MKFEQENKMKISICLDKNNGMMFFGKRQSQDVRQRERFLELIGSNKLFMTSYSAKLFDDLPNIIVNEMPQNIASDEDYYFVEDGAYDIDKCSQIILYKWNRKYPADRFFDVDLLKQSFRKVKSTEFEGRSHEKITEEIYERKNNT